MTLLRYLTGVHMSCDQWESLFEGSTPTTVSNNSKITRAGKYCVNKIQFINLHSGAIDLRSSADNILVITESSFFNISKPSDGVCILQTVGKCYQQNLCVKTSKVLSDAKYFGGFERIDAPRVDLNDSTITDVYSCQSAISYGGDDQSKIRNMQNFNLSYSFSQSDTIIQAKLASNRFLGFSTIYNNTTPTTIVYILADENSQIFHCILMSNQETKTGIICCGFSTLTVSECIFKNNIAKYIFYTEDILQIGVKPIIVVQNSAYKENICTSHANDGVTFLGGNTISFTLIHETHDLCVLHTSHVQKKICTCNFHYRFLHNYNRLRR